LLIAARILECWNRLPESVKSAENGRVLQEKAQRKTRIKVNVGDIIEVMGKQ
jgi:hypothetical protein